MKLKPWARFSLLLIILILLFTFCPNLYDKVKSITLNVGTQVKKTVDIVVENTIKADDKKYKQCLNDPYNSEELDDQTKDLINELDHYINNKYLLSVKYEDVKTGFSYYYKPKDSYYAASTIKLLDALYIYQKAALNEIDLNDSIEYKSSDVLNDSKGMKQHKVGDKISLKELVKYAIIYSDNSAHQMLIHYIGFNNLKNYGNSLGASLTLTGGDNFGYINANDAIKYLKATYNFIENNDNLGKELKEFLVAAEENGIKYDSLNSDVAHKYGYYQNIYNDLGIVYDKYPYMIAILTNHGNGNYKAVTKDISERINNIHQSFYKNRENICKKVQD